MLVSIHRNPNLLQNINGGSKVRLFEVPAMQLIDYYGQVCASINLRLECNYHFQERF